MAHAHRQLAIPALVVTAALAAVFALSGFLEKNRPQLPKSYEDSDLSMQGKRLKGYALGSEGLIADWYWILSLQYIGKKIVENKETDINIDDLRSLNPRLLYPYLDNATDLDPKFYAAYSYGAIVLPAIDPQKAIELTEKGIAANPEKWRLYQYLGYIYWHERNYEKAAETYDRGSMIAGAPPFMREMAAAMKTKGGSRDTARAMYSQMLAEAEDEQSKRNAQLRLFEIDSLEETEAVNEVLAGLRNSNGKCVPNINAALPQLRSVQLPQGRDLRIDRSGSLVDPTGVPYKFDPETCTISLREDSKIPKPLK
ncbi:MAG: hypothetical protein KIT61_14865 [Pyrinomonadaceae bacterium]|jgi:tetratricopeptide (TPR) repeat protein|nr:hypothetical protein [Blastocatellia bacterium]MCW5957866.1 hypothetical protein [Pyrinomonadaceae bacterium]